MTIMFCCDEDRRNLVRAHATINGIDFLEVRDEPSQPLADRQRFLLVTLLKPPAAPLTTDNLRIEGGEAVRNIRVVDIDATGALLTAEVDKAGDFSTYTLRLVATASAGDPPAGYDPLLSAVDFSFKVNCDTDFDCDDDDTCPTPVFEEPQLDYLARDFNSLRQLMVDRMRLLAPDWHEDHLADMTQALIDLKAYVADYQHYQLDAINTEAYLFTARSRVSVRRHARLVDYRMHDGCSARVWAQLLVDEGVAGGVSLPRGTQLLTGVPGLPARFLATSQAYRDALAYAPEFFETLHDATLFGTHNMLCFYTWGDGRCVLPRGATRATLIGHLPNLQANEVLIFEEVRGPATGDPADADPAKRFPIRLSEVSLGRDELTETDVTEIRWYPEDALPAPLCLSADVPPDTSLPCEGAISVARGNIVLADHGRTLPVEELGTVPESTLFYVSQRRRCEPTAPDAVPPRFRPQLGQPQIAQHPPYDHTKALARSAAWATRLSPAAALPSVQLAHDPAFAGETWQPQRDLLNSAGDEPEFVLEIENDGRARVRFGDDENGRRPNAGETFYARYRTGAPLAGNIGADALAHVVISQPAIVGVRNPLPGAGGAAPESIEAVRQNAPQAFRTQERAVTPADYEAIALRFPGVQRAAATIRWTGSWYTVFITVDRLGAAPITAEFERDFRAHMNAYRMMGYDLEVDGPSYVPLEIEVEVCVKPEYFRSAVRAALLAVLSSRALPDGTRGLFHPDNFTFGQPVYLSRIYAAVSGVAGVQSAQVTRFRIQDQPGSSGLATGKIALGRLEIAQLENNPSFPKRGVLRLTMKGGK
ncbi:MAG TPA: putative baseplate assembly protein [Roseiflexaceae bacterium]|nr:putative baseplate assembly protein [Roseiflexaceae bacterium]